MPNQDAPFGLRPIKTSETSQRQNRYRIASAYGTSIFNGDLVLVATDGTITRAPAGGTNLILGVFNGCSYVNSSGEVVYSNYWPSGTVGTNIFANVIDDPTARFEIQSDGAFPVADLYGNFSITATAGSVVSGNSRIELDVSTGANTLGLALKAIDISQDPENSDVSSTNTNVIVIINNHLYSPGTTGLA